ncbi:acylphosphatase [Prosthecodimorpha staleyi]|uniref:acylphosphatase n=1 Tax=Prosthecodimorpha staleyi TaxID=2840188 RepID=A0A947D349_9HYPH|nr:acylphosphatase [Prosthecodimorpha staleyi]MBT9290130.1 acylphosphatase [Prosthecodimorpha staleyi]
MTVRTIRATVSGRVQGVGYREWTRRNAGAAGLAGWVRNRREGTVEAVLSGPDAAVAGLIERLRRGPRSAEVTGVAIEEIAAPEGLPAEFEIRPTV